MRVLLCTSLLHLGPDALDVLVTIFQVLDGEIRGDPHRQNVQHWPHRVAQRAHLLRAQELDLQRATETVRLVGSVKAQGEQRPLNVCFYHLSDMVRESLSVLCESLGTDRALPFCCSMSDQLLPSPAVGR